MGEDARSGEETRGKSHLPWSRPDGNRTGARGPACLLRRVAGSGEKISAQEAGGGQEFSRTNSRGLDREPPNRALCGRFPSGSGREGLRGDGWQSVPNENGRVRS